MKLLKLVLSLSFVLFVSGCEAKPYTYDYLIRHPKVLEKEARRCQIEVVSESCVTVKRAAEDYMTLVNEREDNPEEFGERILKLQMAVSTDKDKSTYQTQLNQLEILSAVVAGTTNVDQ